MTTLATRIAQSAGTTSTAAPSFMKNNDNPKHTAAQLARSIGNRPAPPESSGPDASTTPISMSANPIPTATLNRSPRLMPMVTGTTAPIAAIGETTPIVPSESAA